MSVSDVTETTLGWMGKILGVFKSKPSERTIKRFTSAVADNDIPVVLALWSRFSEIKQSDAFNYCVRNNQYEMASSLLHLVPNALVFECLEEQMKNGRLKWFNVLINKKWTDEECAQLAIIAALSNQPASDAISARTLYEQPSFLDHVYARLGTPVEQVVGSKDDMNDWVSGLSSLPTVGHDPLSFCLYQSIFDVMNDWAIKLRPLVPQDYHLAAILVVMMEIKKTNQVSGKMLEGFENLVVPLDPGDHANNFDISQVFTLSLPNGTKECMDILFKHYPNHQFKVSDLFSSIKTGNQETFDMVFSNVRTDPEIMEFMLKFCVEFARPHMFDQLLPLAIEHKCNLYLSLICCAQTNNVDLTNKLLPLVNPKDHNSEALQWACANGSEDVFSILYPLSDPAKALKELRYKIANSDQRPDDIPNNTALFDIRQTHAAISHAVKKVEASSEPQRKRRM